MKKKRQEIYELYFTSLNSQALVSREECTLFIHFADKKTES